MATVKDGNSGLHVEASDTGLEHLKDVGLRDATLASGALEGTAQEHSMGVFQALKTYKRAAFWSIRMCAAIHDRPKYLFLLTLSAHYIATVISTTVVMEGYDVTLISSFFGYPTFRRKYGAYLDEESGYQISATWQQRFNCLGALANIIGALLNGWATARWGHRRVLMFCLFWLTGLIFIVFFAPTIEVMLLGSFFCGIPWGVFATTGPSYAAEVTPLAIRGYLTAYVNLCWCIGQFISAGVLKGLVDNDTAWSYRVPFAVQCEF